MHRERDLERSSAVSFPRYSPRQGLGQMKPGTGSLAPFSHGNAGNQRVITSFPQSAMSQSWNHDQD